MREAFAAKGSRNVEFFVETMDTMWFDRSEIEPEFLSLFRKKYGSRKIDLLMAAGADALDFAQRFRDVLLPGVPIAVLQCRGRCAARARAPTGYWRGGIAIRCCWNGGPGGAFAAGRTAHRRCERDIGL